MDTFVDGIEPDPMGPAESAVIAFCHTFGAWSYGHLFSGAKDIGTVRLDRAVVVFLCVHAGMRYDEIGAMFGRGPRWAQNRYEQVMAERRRAPGAAWCDRVRHAKFEAWELRHEPGSRQALWVHWWLAGQLSPRWLSWWRAR